MARKVELVGLETLPEVAPGDDLASLIVEAAEREGVSLDNGDILLISQKVVSKAEGRFIDLRGVSPSEEALRLSRYLGKSPEEVEVILKESDEILKVEGGALIVRSKQGIVCANAGVDKSNVSSEGRKLLLLPEDPDSSSERIRRRIYELTGKLVGVVITDTQGRPLREGQINVAVGLSGVTPLKDYRGKRDRSGYVLKVKKIAVADELASAGELIMGQSDEGIPVVVVKGLSWMLTSEKVSAKSLVMPDNRWLFR